MPTYIYKTRNLRGRMIRGKTEAIDPSMLRTKLEKIGLYLTFHKELQRKKSFFGILTGKVRVRTNDLVVFSQQLAAMVSGGVPIIKCLVVLEQQTENKDLQTVISEIRHDIGTGQPLHTSFAKHPSVFSPLFVNLIRAGDASGTLDEVLIRLANYMERNYELKQRVKSAFVYPILVGILIIGVVSFLLIFAVPVFSSIYEKMGISLPIPTLILLRASRFLKSSWWTLGVLVGLILLVRKVSGGSALGKPFFDRLKLSIPIMGKLQQKTLASYFIRAFGAMVKSGVPIIDSLEVVGRVVENTVFVKAIQYTCDQVRKGENISEPLRSTGVFPPMVTQMIAIGEESGNLDDMLEKIGDFLERDVENTTRRLTTMLEPLLTVFMGVVIGFIVLAMYMPMFNLVQVFRR